MESLLILIPLALVLVAVAIKVFFWAVKSGQFEDLETEAHRILFDEEPAKNKKSVEFENQENEKSESSCTKENDSEGDK